MRPMKHVFMAAAIAATASIPAPAQTPGPAAPNPNQKFMTALTAINSINTASIMYVGTGVVSPPGPSGTASPATPVTKYTVSINYGTMSSRVEIERASSPKRLTQFLANGVAWDVTDGKKPAPAPAAAAERQRLIFMTPHGAMNAGFSPTGKRAMANEAGPDGKPVTVMTFTAAGTQLKAYFDDAGMITRVQTLPGDPVLGSTIVEFLYSDYKDYDTTPLSTPKPKGAGGYGGIMFPAHVVEKVGGQTVLDLTMTQVRPNAGLYVEVPPSVERAAGK